MNTVVGRFAPSPTGRLHAGNIFAALCAWLIAKSQDGEVVLRIEDLDAQRSKPAYASALQRDFEYLGLTWDRGPFFQSTRTQTYREAAEQLSRQGLLYPCFCTRADRRAASAPHGEEKRMHACPCRKLSAKEGQQRVQQQGQMPAMRLIVPDKTYCFTDGLQGKYCQNLEAHCGDFIVQRADGAFAYQLAVVIDDAEQGISSVVRGADLLCSTPQQLYLQDLLGFNHPHYHHIPLLVNAAGQRLSKRDQAASIDEVRTRLKTPEAIIGFIAGTTGLTPTTQPITPTQLLEVGTFSALRGKQTIVWQEGDGF
ncbi:MAG: tRNA glutamyl-Q(34) synthetase GluQRS [Raoultibacter sp.]